MESMGVIFETLDTKQACASSNRSVGTEDQGGTTLGGELCDVAAPPHSVEELAPIDPVDEFLY